MTADRIFTMKTIMYVSMMKGTQKTIIDIYILRDDDSYINHRPGIDTSHNVTHAVAPAPASQ